MKQNNNEENITFDNIDILGSIEFDLTEAIKDLIYNLQLIKKDVAYLKKEIKQKH